MATDELNQEGGSRRRRFFDDELAPLSDDLPPGSVRAAAAPYNAPRGGMTAATEVLNLGKIASEQQNRGVQSWQESAWGYTDQIGELKFAFNLVAQVVSRAMLYPAVVAEQSEVPVATNDYLEQYEDENPLRLSDTFETAEDAVTALVESGQAEILRMLALNFSIPGECYLIKEPTKSGPRWTVASTSEFTPGRPPFLNRSKDNKNRKALPADTYAARLWRAHPRWYNEPDSSMLGVLDQCEKVVLFDQVMRAIARSRMGAGIVVVPNGLSPVVEGLSLEEAISKATIDPVESEASARAVVPLVLSGPAELADKIKRIDLGRDFDSDMMVAYEGAIDRMLAGVDIPKNIVTGLADVKFANALVIDDALYKAHIEPLLLLVCDALTEAFLHPTLRKAGVDEKLLKRLVIWYNPSQIVTRPDRSQAASEGYDKMLLSAKAWRGARGFSEAEAPDKEEIIQRLGLEKAQIPPEIAVVLIEALNPEFFADVRKANQQEAGVPDDVSSILSGDEAPVPEEPGAAEDEAPGESGGEITPGGTLPPVQSDVQEMLR